MTRHDWDTAHDLDTAQDRTRGRMTKTAPDMIGACGA